MAYHGEKKREYQIEWRAKRKNAFFSGKKCAWCGSEVKLELHHLDPKLKIDHEIWTWSQARREAEIDKCIVLCYDCHRKYHAEKRKTTRVHGTPTGYTRRKCRCAACTKAHADRQRDYRNEMKHCGGLQVWPTKIYRQK